MVIPLDASKIIDRPKLGCYELDLDSNSRDGTTLERMLADPSGQRRNVTIVVAVPPNAPSDAPAVRLHQAFRDREDIQIRLIDHHGHPIDP